MFPWRRIVVVGVLAFGVGTLFRLGAETGIGLYRMFGTMGIGISGAVAAWTMSRWQTEAGVGSFKERLAGLEGVKVYSVAGALRTRDVTGELLLERDGTYFLIATMNVPNYGGRRYARRARAAVLTVTRWGGGFSEGELGRILVYLRRGVRPDEKQFAEEQGVVIINPDELSSKVFGEAARLAAERQTGDSDLPAHAQGNR